MRLSPPVPANTAALAAKRLDWEMLKLWARSGRVGSTAGCGGCLEFWATVGRKEGDRGGLRFKCFSTASTDW